MFRQRVSYFLRNSRSRIGSLEMQKKNYFRQSRADIPAFDFTVVDPMIFKKVFGTVENKRLFISLINAITESSSDKFVIEDVEFIDTTKAPVSRLYGNSSEFDIKAIAFGKKDIIKGRPKRLNVEVKMSEPSYYNDKRAMNSACELFYNQLLHDKDRYIDYDIEKCISVHIATFRLLPQTFTNYHNVFCLKEKTCHLPHPTADFLELHILELEKFNGEVKSPLDGWMKFFHHDRFFDAKHHIPENIKQEEYSYAVRELRNVVLSKEERYYYFGWMKRRLDLLSNLHYLQERDEICDKLIQALRAKEKALEKAAQNSQEVQEIEKELEKLERRLRAHINRLDPDAEEDEDELQKDEPPSETK